MIIMKSYQYFILIIFYFKHGLSKNLSFFCYRFMFKYLKDELKFFIQK
jgi:hypothetical protein